MKQGQTVHDPFCTCPFCEIGFTKDMKHPKDRLERLYINAKKDRRKAAAGSVKRKGQEDVPTENYLEEGNSTTDY